MSDGAIATLASAGVTIVITVVGFLTLWVKLRYGTQKAEEAAVKAEAVEKKIDQNSLKTQVVENKLDQNTAITTEAKDAANKASEHSAACDDDRSKFMRDLMDHDTRISALEAKVEAIRAGMEAVSKNLDSTRHEMRGHLQTISTSLQLISVGNARQQQTKESK